VMPFLFDLYFSMASSSIIFFEMYFLTHLMWSTSATGTFSLVLIGTAKDDYSVNRQVSKI
jgi:hypothetical protein